VARFLKEIWEDDHLSRDTLAETMGYVLGGETSQQKMFMLVGPKRSGKGTIARVLTGLLGTHSTAAPTLSSLATNFGLSPLIGKPLAVVSDARLGTRTDGLIAVERLLSISGEDTITVDVKYRDPWTGRLPTRFVILTNELPRFTDSSRALASRFVLLMLSKSWYGQEDPTLTDQLLAEAPSIFNWALEGLDRLHERGYFVQPDSAREALRHLEDLSLPVSAFLRNRCELGPGHQVSKDELFAAWRSWCEEEGRDRPGTKSVFFRDLRAALPGTTEHRLREGGRRWLALSGLRLRTHSSVSLTKHRALESDTPRAPPSKARDPRDTREPAPVRKPSLATLATLATRTGAGGSTRARSLRRRSRRSSPATPTSSDRTGRTASGGSSPRTCLPVRPSPETAMCTPSKEVTRDPARLSHHPTARGIARAPSRR
jgi:P4 family phage/plasmid primase-like protien